MKLTEATLRKYIRQLLKEGVYDPGIFKAVFMAGGPGSGKSYTAKSVFGGDSSAAQATVYATCNRPGTTKEVWASSSMVPEMIMRRLQKRKL